MDRIAKYFDNAEADVTIRVEKNVQIAEIKVSANGEMFRAVTEDKDLYASIDKDIDILGLGFNAYDTTVVTQVKKTIAGSSIEAVMAFPKYQHIVMCSVLSEITVSGIDETFVG